MESPVTGLPLAVETLLDSLLRSMRLTSWNVSGGKTVSVTLRFGEQEQDGSQSIAYTPGSFRRKTPSSVRRDRKRKQKWLVGNNSDILDSGSLAHIDQRSDSLDLDNCEHNNEVPNLHEHAYSLQHHNVACQTVTHGVGQCDLENQSAEVNCSDCNIEALTNSSTPESKLQCFSDTPIMKCDDPISDSDSKQSSDYRYEPKISCELDSAVSNVNIEEIAAKRRHELFKGIFKCCGVCDTLLNSNTDLRAIHVCTHCDKFYLCWDCFENESYKEIHDHYFDYKQVYDDSYLN